MTIPIIGNGDIDSPERPRVSTAMGWMRNGRTREFREAMDFP